MPQGWEWAILVLIALLLFGGSRLSGIGRNPASLAREPKEESATLGALQGPLVVGDEALITPQAVDSSEIGEVTLVEVVEAELAEGPSEPKQD
jgi:sec-independent protein translocase protein TatA